MEKSIYQEIAARTGGDIYVGVVGPVRTGKSTLIKRVMEELVEKSLQMQSREEVMELFLGSAVKGREMIRKLLSSQLREQTERLMIDSIRSWFQELTDRKELFQDVSRADAQVALDFYTFAVAGILLEYCMKPNVNIKRLSGQLIRLMEGRLLKEA